MNVNPCGSCFRPRRISLRLWSACASRRCFECRVTRPTRPTRPAIGWQPLSVAARWHPDRQWLHRRVRPRLHGRRRPARALVPARCSSRRLVALTGRLRLRHPHARGPRRVRAIGEQLSVASAGRLLPLARGLTCIFRARRWVCSDVCGPTPPHASRRHTEARKIARTVARGGSDGRRSGASNWNERSRPAISCGF